MKAYNSQQIGIVNRRQILRYLAQNPGSSRSVLADDLKLSRASVSEHTAKMIQEGLILEERSDEKAVGRRSVLLDLNPASKYILTLDLNAESPLAVIFDLKGEILKEVNLQTDLSLANEKLRQELTQEISAILASSEILSENLASVSFCVPGVYNKGDNSLFANGVYSSWPLDKVQAAIRDSLPTDPFTVICNDVNAAAIGESVVHYSHHEISSSSPFTSSSFVYILAGRGLGAGIIIDGNLYEGVSGMAGEISQFLFGSKKPAQEIALDSILAKMEVYLESTGSKLYNLEPVQTRPRLADKYKLFVQLLRLGDAYIIQLLEEVAEVLGQIILSIIAVLNPDSIVLGGAYSEAAKIILPRINQLVQEKCINPIEIKIATRGRLATVYGLFSLAQNELLDKHI